MRAWLHAKSFAAPWVLFLYLTSWSMLMLQPCCYAVAAALPAEPLQQAGCGHGHQTPGNESDQDHCNQVISGDLTTLVVDSTPTQRMGLPLLPPPPMLAALARAHADTASFFVSPQSLSPPYRRPQYLVTARLRI
jgi:hypothetical protein